MVFRSRKRQAQSIFDLNELLVVGAQKDRTIVFPMWRLNHHERALRPLQFSHQIVELLADTGNMIQDTPWIFKLKQAFDALTDVSQ